MLKITQIEGGAGQVVLRLEGRVVGPWVEELERSCEAVRRPGRLPSLDLAEVTYADAGGLALLTRLARLGFELRGANPFLTRELKPQLGPSLPSKGM